MSKVLKNTSRVLNFRIWNTKTQEMLEDAPVSGTLNDLLSWRDFHFLQFTGLKDRNGQKIYEGDIITHGQYWYKVEFQDGCFCVKTDSGYDLLWKIATHSEVQGNIYENKGMIDA